ncbi:MAG: DUF2520 domain-containing protein [Vicinamibacterales bacterium]
MQFPSTGIVGTGALALALGRALQAKGVPIVAVASASRERAERAARELGVAVQPVLVADLPRLARHILIATADGRIEAVAEELASAELAGVVALHTCGAAGPAALVALRGAGVPVGVFHPLQTVVEGVSTERVFDGVAFAIAGDRAARAWAEELAGRLAGRVLSIHDDAFAAYHAGAVLASNGIAALIHGAVSLLGQGGVAPDAALSALAPLARAATDNVLRLGPAAALTGPVARGDAGTVARHVAALGQSPPEIDALYRAVTRCLIRVAAERQQAPEIRDALTSALDARLKES